MKDGRGGSFPFRDCRAAVVTADGVETESIVPKAPALARALTRLILDFEVGLQYIPQRKSGNCRYNGRGRRTLLLERL